MLNIKKALCLFVGLLLLAGCASTQDLNRVKNELGQMVSVQANDIQVLKRENADLHKALEGNQEAIAVLRKTQAESNADMTGLKDLIQQLTGRTEELQKEMAALRKTSRSKDEEIAEKLNRAAFKIDFVENFLGIGKKDAVAEAAEKGSRSAGSRQKDVLNGKSEKEVLYAAAYETFKEGKYEKARAEFQNFLKLHPGTEYSGNAQFWIGECYYNEQQYEKAILEYEKVVKDYPEGNKVPFALFKQGLAFLNLGDKTSARLFLQQVIRDYPNTNQARVARTKLLEIK
ncbi:MAG: tol-pal system protein YbgF [Syntrophus sp. (in: bacteria)]|nr:tol-pal system protein YbgF [Syntrophus sp. (in: bacteria)]